MAAARQAAVRPVRASTPATTTRTSGTVAAYGGQGTSANTVARVPRGASDQTRPTQAAGPMRVPATRGTAHSTARPWTVSEARASPWRTGSGRRVGTTVAKASAQARHPGTVHWPGTEARSTPPTPATRHRPPARAELTAMSRSWTNRAAARAIVAARASRAAARAAEPGSAACQQSHPAERTPEAPMPHAPTTATIRTDSRVARSATAVSAAAATRSTAVSVCGPAPMASAQRSGGSCAVAAARGRGSRSTRRAPPPAAPFCAASSRAGGTSALTPTPYATHVPARTAAAAAANRRASVPVSRTSCSAYASRTVSAIPRPATASAVEPSPRRSSATGAPSAATVTAPSTSARPAIPICPQLTRVKAIAAIVSRVPPRSSSTFCTFGAAVSGRRAAVPAPAGHADGVAPGSWACCWAEAARSVWTSHSRRRSRTARRASRCHSSASRSRSSSAGGGSVVMPRSVSPSPASDMSARTQLLHDAPHGYARPSTPRRPESNRRTASRAAGWSGPGESRPRRDLPGPGARR